MKIQNNPVCYEYNSLTKTKSMVNLPVNYVDGGYFAKPPQSSYIDPDTISITENETLILIDENLPTERWEKKPWYIGTKLLYKNAEDKTAIEEIEIKEIGDTPENYPNYTSKKPKKEIYKYYYVFDEKKNDWVMDFNKIYNSMIDRMKSRGKEDNIHILPIHTRDNIYTGADEGYPVYLKGKKGIENIGKLNMMFRDITKKYEKMIEDLNIEKDEMTYFDILNEIVEGIEFPNENDMENIVHIFKEETLSIDTYIDEKVVKAKKFIKTKIKS